VIASSTSVVWLSPSATSYSCLCEACLESARAAGESFVDAVHAASVRGSVDRAATVAFARCRAGHELVLRRVERPPSLAHADERQLRLG
jgi:hypothetical protein